MSGNAEGGRSLRRVLVVVALPGAPVALSIAGLILLVHTVTGGHWLGGRTEELVSVQEVTSITGVSLPATANLLGGECRRRGKNPYLIARISIPAGDVPSFFAGSTVFGDQSSDRKAFQNRDSRRMAARGWDVDSIQQFVSAEGWVRPGAESVAVVIDLDGPETAVMYLRWWIL